MISALFRPRLRQKGVRPTMAGYVAPGFAKCNCGRTRAGCARSKTGWCTAGERHLAYLSREVRRALDTAGLHEVKIIASNQLDEFVIRSYLPGLVLPGPLAGPLTFLGWSASQTA